MGSRPLSYLFTSATCRILHCAKVWHKIYPICDTPLSTVLVFEQKKPYSVWFSSLSLSGIVRTKPLFLLRWCYTRRRRFLAQHSVASLLRYCFEWLQHCSNIVTLCCAKNTGEPLLLDISFQVTSPLRGHFYSGDTLVEPEGVPWIEVSLYSVKQERGGKRTVRRDPNFPVDCKQFLGIVARVSFLRARERGKSAKRCSLAHAKIQRDCLQSC